MNHILCAQQFNVDAMEKMFESTRLYEDAFAQPDSHELMGNILEGKTMATLFYEASTRTRFSFETAMQKLGGKVISTENAMEFSSTAKGESLEDTIRVVGDYADVIVLRHPEEGAAARAAAVSSVPVINAGDGAGQHPTQALIDMYTIHKKFNGDFTGLNIGLVGDIMHSRTIHSLAYLLGKYPIEHLCMIGDVGTVGVTGLPLELETHMFENDVPIGKCRETLKEIAPILDVIYMTRAQTERHALNIHVSYSEDHAITKDVVDVMNPDAIVMHPLPRLQEIPTWFDEDPRAHYFQQASYGVPMRAVLLQIAMSPSS